MRKIEVLEEAQHDLIRGYFFYEGQDQGLGSYFRNQIRLDIRAIGDYFGQHRIYFGYHRALSHVFPYAIYYRDFDDIRQIIAILDMRQSPDKIQSMLKAR